MAACPPGASEAPVALPMAAPVALPMAACPPGASEAPVALPMAACPPGASEAPMALPPGACCGAPRSLLPATRDEARRVSLHCRGPLPLAVLPPPPFWFF